jgi:site-specific DNA-methyltransferase (adenine-specific)
LASSNEGDLVADFYAGSFTTAKVCKDLNRNFIGCDINPKAVEIGIKRLNNK